MKKLLTIALLTLSPLTFAKDFNPDLLIGMWQCEAIFDYPKLKYKGKENNISIFRKDGTRHAIGTLQAFENGKKNVIKFEDLGKWKIINNNFSVNTEKLLNYQASNESIAESQRFKDFVAQDKSFNDKKILIFTKNTLVFSLNDGEKLQDEAKMTETCYRIKQ